MVMTMPDTAVLEQPTTAVGDRFEFRVFGPCPGAEAVLRAIAGAGRFEAAVDRYVLVPDRLDVGLKLSDMAVELKTLQEVAGGLERWHPGGRVPLPARGTDLGILADFGLPQPPADRSFGDASDLAGWLADQGVAVACLRKRRRRFLLENAQGELGEVTRADCHLKTLAVESVDASAAAAIVARLGLSDAENTSYPRLLATAQKPPAR
jgi:hypothetical protein